MTSGLDEGIFELIRQGCIRHKKKKKVPLFYMMQGETDESGLWWLEKRSDECDGETVLCGREHQNQMCVSFSVPLSLFVLVRIPNYLLTIKHLGDEQTHTCSQVQLKEKKTN